MSHDDDSLDPIAHVGPRLLESLERAAAADESLRDALRTLARALLALAERTEPRQAPTAPSPAPPPASAGAVHVPLRLGDAEAQVPVAADGSDRPTPYAAPTPATAAGRAQVPVGRSGREAARGLGAAPESAPDLALAMRRLDVKAQACRWAIERRRRISAGADFRASIKPRDDELLSAARALPNCYVWPMDPYVRLPADEELERAAQCYENLRSAAAFALTVHDEGASDSELLETSYALLAEAQSMVRAVMKKLDLRDDADQLEAFHWLRRRTEEDHVYVERYMKLNDIADPLRAESLAERLEEQRRAWETLRRQTAQRTQLLNRARYHVGRLGGDTPHPLDHWQRLHDAVAELVRSGLAPSHIELRDLLLPHLDAIPDGLAIAPEFRAVLREIDRYLASRDAERPAPTAEPSDDVRRVRELLRGRVVVLIGGERRPETCARLERTFELRRLDWVSTREHESISALEPFVARPDTALVLLAIRWSSHSHEEVADLCARYGKPFARLPGGYGANQIAYQVLQQASDALRGLPPIAA